MKRTLVCSLAAMALLGAAMQTGARAQDSAFFGAMMAPLTPNIQHGLAIEISKGAAIGDIVAGSPAAAAGLRGDDVIIDIDGQPVDSPQDVIAVIERHRPGDRIAVQILDSRNGHRANTVSVTLAARPSGFHPDQQPGPQPVPASGRPKSDLTPPE
ncbi:MAG TPA: PDZ domain-containing protein [Micropepsaceae bacterium]|jgi:S1-C subfamily serine protease